MSLLHTSPGARSHLGHLGENSCHTRILYSDKLSNKYKDIFCWKEHTPKSSSHIPFHRELLEDVFQQNEQGEQHRRIYGLRAGRSQRNAQNDKKEVPGHSWEAHLQSNSSKLEETDAGCQLSRKISN